MADNFYTKEGKKRVKDPVFRMKFRDLLDMITLRAGTLKAQGLHSASTGSGLEKHPIRIAATSAGRPQERFQEQGRSNFHTEWIPSVKCSFCPIDHQPELCPKFLDMTAHERADQVRKMRLCYRCLEAGHLLWRCSRPVPKCGQCGKDHITVLHWPRDYYATTRTGQNENQQQTTQQTTSTASSTGGGNEENRA